MIIIRGKKGGGGAGRAQRGTFLMVVNIQNQQGFNIHKNTSSVPPWDSFYECYSGFKYFHSLGRVTLFDDLDTESYFVMSLIPNRDLDVDIDLI